jgi:predicted enzyme related to lactoylglutathione lyase
VPEGESGWLTFYVEVPDVEAALAQAERLGGTRQSGPDQVMEGLVIGQFTDPPGTWSASRRTARRRAERPQRGPVTSAV